MRGGRSGALADAAAAAGRAQYEPELFPGLIYRMKEPKVVLLIFVSGKVVLTGAQPAPSKVTSPMTSGKVVPTGAEPAPVYVTPPIP